MKSNLGSRSREKSTFGRRMGQIFNRALATVTMRMHVAAANLWRDNYNPLRGLTISRAVTLLEEGERGAYGDLQWTYRYIEMQDATLGALLERRTSAIQKLDWDIKIRDKVPAGKEQIAKIQEQALREAYERVKNFSAAVEFMVMASFRGYAHLEKVTDANGDVVEFAPVEQWFWVRQGLYGQWQLNREARSGRNTGEDVPLPRFIIREVARPINRVALIAFVRKNLSQKDWDGFIEAYGIPAVFVIMPPSVPADKEDEYFAAADAVTSDARGVLPGGSEIKTVDNGARGTNPFAEHLKYQDEQIVMRGTGGKLTMLSEATGIGGGASDEHADTFEAIAKADAAEISEVLRQQFDAEILARVTPGEAAYAYFELAANEETDTGAIVKDIRELSGAGYKVSSRWITEKTGYEIEPALPAAPALPVRNRLLPNDTIPWIPAEYDAAQAALREALARDMQPLCEALFGAYEQRDSAAFKAALRKIGENADLSNADALTDWLESELVEAWIGDVEPIRNSGNSQGAIKGWETRRRNGWQAKPRNASEAVSSLVDDALDNTTDPNERVTIYGDVTEEEAALLDLEPGYKRAMSRHAIRHIMKSHGDPATEDPRGQLAVTRDDIKRVPEIIAQSQAAKHAGRTRIGADTIRYFYDDPQGGTTTVLDEIRTGRKQLIVTQIIKFKGTGIREVPGEPKKKGSG